MAAALACRCRAGSRCRVPAQRVPAAAQQRGCMANARFIDDLVQPARHLARRARQAGELALLGRHQRRHGFSVLRTTGVGDGGAQRVAHGNRSKWFCRLAPSLSRAGHAGGAGVISGEQLQHVPGCENGDAPFSQELLGGGKVNRSFLVRTRRGRFVVRLNENTAVDPGLDRAREIALHTAAAGAGIAPHIIYACPSHTFLITDYVEGRLWTPHYFTRMRDLRALGQRLGMLHALAPPAVARFDPMVTARRYAETIVRSDPADAERIGALLERGDQAYANS